MITGQLLYAAEAETNLAGKGLVKKWGIGIVNCWTGIRVFLMECSESLGAKLYLPLNGKTLKWGGSSNTLRTVVPQGLPGPRNLFGQVVEQFCEQFQPRVATGMLV